MTLPQGKCCNLPIPDQCLCKVRPQEIKACLYMKDAPVSEESLQRAEAASGMTREQAVAPNSILSDLTFVDTGPTTASLPAVPANPAPSPVAPANAEPVNPEFREAKNRANREACEVAFERVRECTTAFLSANNALEGDARSSVLRRKQRNAFNDLSQAQYTLEMSFDKVPPRIE